jgi:hypothetical protein
MTLTLAALITLAAFPALAETAPFKPGDFIMAFRDYDYKTDTFTEGAPKGEEHACFRIDSVTPV